jgi:hypothetical protein
MAEPINDLSTLIDKKFLEVPLDCWWFLLDQIFINWIRIRTFYINLKRIKEGHSTVETFNVFYHRENFRKFRNSIKFAPTIELRIFKLAHRFTKLTAGEKEN